MAVRSGAGTGVVVSLVVFVMLSVFLLIMTIVFYRGQTQEREKRAEAESALDIYATAPERNSDLFKRYESEARQNRASVAQFLHQQRQSAMEFMVGNPNTTIPAARELLAAENVPNDASLRTAIADLNRNLRAAQGENANLNQSLQNARADVAEKEALISDMKRQHEEAMATAKASIDNYGDAAEQYRTELYEAIAALNDAEERLENQYVGQINELDSENDQLQRERVVLMDRISQLESRINEQQLSGQSPELLVDGRIIEFAGGNDRVFIDRGANDRIVNGMTFEVYEDASSLGVDPITGQLRRGKASLQVIKVGDTTSTCKITRSIPGRPVVRGNVIANAVFDPDYKFKFLVHGKFDVDGDGRPSESEADFLRDRIIKWGGEVIEGEELPGDLDFLVLGIRPPKPPQPRRRRQRDGDPGLGPPARRPRQLRASAQAGPGRPDPGAQREPVLHPDRLHGSVIRADHS